MNTDPALETLFLPLREGYLRWPSEAALLLNARDGWPLHQQLTPGLLCEQGFKPEFDALQRSGVSVLQRIEKDARFALVLALPPRNREAARALYARAMRHLVPGGVLIVCQTNSEGAKSGEIDLSRIAGALTVLSKNKCRVFWTRPNEPRDEEQIAQWAKLDVPRPILDGRFVSRPGVFAWDRIDRASQLLVDQLPSDLTGRAADFGAGFGFLSSQLMTRCAGIRALDVIEADTQALDLARLNLAAFDDRVALRYQWHDVMQGVADRYDVIVCNPPFHAQQGAERPDIGRRFISAAADALNPGGRLWMVANRHLPYESVLNAAFGEVRVHAQQDGFKAIEAIKAVGSKKTERRR